MALPALTEQERALSYSKFFDLPMEYPSPELEESLRIPMDPKDGIYGADLLKAFSEKGNPASENKYCFFEDGSAYVDTMVELPDVEGPMLGWWFNWFMIPPEGIPEEMGNLRSKIWDPINHWDSRGALAVETFDDGAGDPLWYSYHCSLKPEEYGFSAEKVKELQSRGIFVSCSVNKTEGMADRIGMNLQQPRPGGGFITRARYWFGWTVRDGKPVRDLSREQYSEEMVIKILRHNIVEKMRLNSLLPPLFREEAKKG